MKTFFLYDGECGLCHWAVRFFIRTSKSKDLCFSSVYSDFSKKLLDELVEIYDPEDEGAIYVRGDKAYRKSTAILQALADCNAPFSWVSRLLVIPENFRNFLYSAFAKRRMRICKALRLKCKFPSGIDQSRIFWSGRENFLHFLLYQSS